MNQHQPGIKTLALPIAQSAVSKKRAALAFSAIVGLFIMVMPEMAMAAPWDGAAQKVIAIFTGGFARSLAIIAVMGLGIAAWAGKLSWQWAINIILGIVLVFGAAAIVDYFISAVGS